MHREHIADFWISAATIVALFVPIWGLLLMPSRMIYLPTYLLGLGVPALLVVIGALIYGAVRNRVFLNRFLVGYAGGLLGTVGISLFFAIVGPQMGGGPNLIVILGNSVFDRPIATPPALDTIVVGTTFHALLDGAAWGAAYALLLGKVPWWEGLFFGFFIWAVLVLSPPFYAWGFTGMRAGAVGLFALLIGHLVYGSLVGWVVARYAFPEIGMEGVKAVRPVVA